MHLHHSYMEFRLQLQPSFMVLSHIIRDFRVQLSQNEIEMKTLTLDLLLANLHAQLNNAVIGLMAQLVRFVRLWTGDILGSYLVLFLVHTRNYLKTTFSMASWTLHSYAYASLSLELSAGCTGLCGTERVPGSWS